jgi:hypothetical protein
MLRFTIRDVLWLTIVMGLVVGWTIDHSKQQSRNYHFEMVRWMARAELLKQHVENNGATVSWRRSQLGDAEEVAVESGGNSLNYSYSLVGDDEAPLSLRPWESKVAK